MGQALYRKYRPRSFSEAVGQDAITKTLKEAVKSGRISHAYLFAGPRGVGKTSVARILAHEVNDLPYKHDSVHLDIIEIDAASNRRIDEIRDLREKVHIAPTSSKFKVYIIDEVHMLTKEAFNALLKTLEEPPSHCIFILATTELHKLPETIVSRTQVYNFKPISPKTTKNHLKKIARSEKIDIDVDAIELLSEFGEGSMRDIIGLLDQLSSKGSKITQDDIRNLVGIPQKASLDKLLASIIEANPKVAIEQLENLRDQASSPAVIAKYLASELRVRLIEQSIIGKWGVKLLKDLLEVDSSSHPQETLEIAILEASSRSDKLNSTKKEETNVNKPASLRIRSEDSETVKQKVESTDLTPVADKNTFDLKNWDELLERTKQEAPSLYSALRISQPQAEGGKLKLVFPFSLHQKKLNQAKNKSIINRLIAEVSGSTVSIECILDKDVSKNNQHHKKQITRASFAGSGQSVELQAISNIFGSAEVLES